MNSKEILIDHKVEKKKTGSLLEGIWLIEYPLGNNDDPCFCPSTWYGRH